jgi:hypothetical protein
LWSDGNLTTTLDRFPDGFAFAHPGTTALWAGLLRMVGGERLADLAQLAPALLGAAAVAAFARRTGLHRAAALLAGSAFLLVPMVALQIGTQANDVTGAAFVMTAIALTCIPSDSWTPGRAAAVGLALGLAATVGSRASLVAAATGAAALFLLLRARGGARRETAGGVALLGLTFAAVVAPWWLRNLVREGNPIYPQALPFIGHGVNINSFGTVDSTFVPSTWAWPLYPFLEAIDDRSGFGALFCVALLPGLVVAFWKGRRQPLLVLGWTFAVMLPFWWLFTLHEPRFFLAQAGLLLVCVPWALIAVATKARPWTAGVLACAVLLSTALVLDQQLLPLAAQPTDRTDFYDRVYAVDPVVIDLDEDTGLLLVTGLGLPQVDYASTYPLLGPGQRRQLEWLDITSIGDSRQVVPARMRVTGIRLAYVTAVPGNEPAVERLFAAPDFRLVHSSQVRISGAIGARRSLFSDADESLDDVVARRYLFELVDEAPPG